MLLTQQRSRRIVTVKAIVCGQWREFVKCLLKREKQQSTTEAEGVTAAFASITVRLINDAQSRGRMKSHQGFSSEICG